MLFSIVTVTRNNLEGLKSTARSVSVQERGEFEWIVIDGASEDGTREYLETVEADWISEPDNGIYDAMNKGIERARGDYLIFLNAGDVFASASVLSVIRRTLEEKRQKPALIYGDAVEEGRTKKARSHTQVKQGMFTHHQAMLYARTGIGNMRYELSYEIAADYDFTCRFLKTVQDVLYLPVPVCVFETGGVSQRRAGLGRSEQRAVREKLNMCGRFENSLIAARQNTAWLLRKTCPHVFWLLKR